MESYLHIMYQGEACFRKQNYSAAIKHFEQALKYKRNYYEALIFIGLSYFHQEKFEKSISAFDMAIADSPDKPEPYTHKEIA